MAAGPRRWHLTRTWREHVWNELPAQAAVDALTRGLPPAGLVEAICDPFRSALLQVRGRSRGATEEAQDQRLVTAIIERLVKNGFDAGPVLGKMARAPAEWDPLALAACLLAYHAAKGTDPPKKLDRILAAGLAAARWPETKALLLARLDPRRRAALGERKPSPR
jgi:hypothetical protein